MYRLRRLHFKASFYLIFLLTFFIATAPAQAYSITPVKSLFTVDQGTSQSIIVKIKNTEKNNLNFKLNVLGMTQDESGKPIFARGIDAAESWVYPESNSVNIKSGETKSVNFIIKIPTDAVSGSYYLGLAVEPILEKSNQASLSARLVSLLTLEVKGLVQESLTIENWKYFGAANYFDEAPELQTPTLKKNWKFDLNLKNSGTIEVLLQGKLAIRNWRGEEIFSQPLILGNKLLAGSKRVLHPIVILKNNLSLSDNISLPGLYSAQIKINYGRTNQTVSAIAYVWYFPMWSKVVLGAVGLFLIILTALIYKKLRKR